jgi:hypothetical protein
MLMILMIDRRLRLEQYRIDDKRFAGVGPACVRLHLLNSMIPGCHLQCNLAGSSRGRSTLRRRSLSASLSRPHQDGVDQSDTPFDQRLVPIPHFLPKAWPHHHMDAEDRRSGGIACDTATFGLRPWHLQDQRP